jgi:hypothetical protein
VAIAGKWCQGEGETAHRLPIGRAVAWSGSRGAGLQTGVADSSAVRPGPSSSRSVKPATRRRRRQRRAVPGGDRRQAVPGRRRDSAPAADRACRGLVSGVGCAGKPRLPLAWPVLAALDHRQFFRVFVLSIGEAGHEGDDGASVEQHLVAIAGKRARAKARQHTGSRSGLPWPGRGVGWQASVAGVRQVAAGVARAGGLDHRQFGPGLRPLDR